jgi:hypothetical protein
VCHWIVVDLGVGQQFSVFMALLSVLRYFSYEGFEPAVSAGSSDHGINTGRPSQEESILSMSPYFHISITPMAKNRPHSAEADWYGGVNGCSKRSVPPHSADSAVWRW